MLLRINRTGANAATSGIPGDDDRVSAEPYEVSGEGGAEETTRVLLEIHSFVTGWRERVDNSILLRLGITARRNNPCEEHRNPRFAGSVKQRLDSGNGRVSACAHGWRVLQNGLLDGHVTADSIALHVDDEEYGALAKGPPTPRGGA